MNEVRAYEPILSQIMLTIAKETRFYCEPSLSEILSENPKLVIVFNHSSPLSWLPAIGLLAAHVCARGGGGRRPMGVVDRFFFEVPLIKTIASLLTQADHAPSFDHLTESFVEGNATDLIVFPEGSNCFFGDPADLKDFRSPKFVELAVRANAPILICVHKGSEEWGMTLPVPPDWMAYLDYLPPFAKAFLETRLKETGMLTVPMWPKKMDKFEMRCTLYHPQLKAENLPTQPEEKRAVLQLEADRIRAKMLEGVR